jgi:hypothetical protein
MMAHPRFNVNLEGKSLTFIGSEKMFQTEDVKRYETHILKPIYVFQYRAHFEILKQARRSLQIFVEDHVSPSVCNFVSGQT